MSVAETGTGSVDAGQTGQAGQARQVSYTALLRMPEVAGPLAWASVCRLAYGVLPFSLVLFLVARSGSYAQAGAVAAAYAVGAGLLGPIRGRWIDLYHPGLVLAALGVVQTGALVLLTLASHLPPVVVIGLGALAGCSVPSIGALLRASWRRRLGSDEAVLTRLYAVDASSEELLFLVGPLVAAACVNGWGGGPVVVGSAVGLLLAAVGLTFSVRCPTAQQRAAVAAGPPLWRNIAFLVGLGPLAGLGFLLGVVEIAAISAVLADARPSLVGIPSALVSCGSMVGGLLYGRRTWPGSVTRQASILALGSAALVVIAGVSTHAVIPMALLLGLAGLFISPAFVCGYVIADRATPKAAAEAGSWVNAVFNVSLAGGYAVAGLLVDAWSPGWALTAAAVLASGVVLACAHGPTGSGALDPAGAGCGA